MNKFVSAFFIVPALGFVSAQASTVMNHSTATAESAACKMFQSRGSLAVLTDVRGLRHFRVNHSTNSFEIYSPNSQMNDRIMKAMGTDVYVEGCKDADGRVMVTKLVVLKDGSGDHDQGGSQGDGQGSGGYDQGGNQGGGQGSGGYDQGDQGQDHGQGGYDQGDQGQGQGHGGYGQGDQGGYDQGQGQGQGQGGYDQGDQGDYDQGQGQHHHHRH